MIGRFHCLVVDCPDPRALATFYERMLGLERVEDTDEWVTIGGPGAAVCVAFQRVESFVPPRWPDPAAPQQMHMDVLVDNLDEAEAGVLALGGSLLEGSDKPIGYRVYADPAGHPFCLVTPEGVG
ncbi:MAG TPA: VOC family protein [Actinomycetota bacterium]|nr:VOC family protein [Actinomycetota bacterium]